MSEEVLHCETCESEVLPGDEYCPNCGTLFVENVKCINHSETDATGVCIICSEPFCSRCGDLIDKLFLCREHEKYEVVQNHARVWGSSDELIIRFYFECLENEGLHPVIFDRTTRPWNMGFSEYTYLGASVGVNGHAIDEIKLMVPCNELLEAEKIINDLETSENNFEENYLG